MADENLIGRGACPVCGNVKARFTFSIKKLACMTCNTCNVQIFARSDSSDEKLRAMVKEDKPAPAPAAQAPAATPPAATAEKYPDPIAKPADTAQNKQPKTWGFFGVQA